MFGFFKPKPPPAPPPLPLAAMRTLDPYKFYACCLLLLFVLKTLIGVMRRARVRAVAAKGKSAKFVPLLGKEPAAPPGSKGKAVVVGGGAFLGRHVVEQLVHKGYKVHVFDVPGGTVHARATDVVYSAGDVTSVEQLRGAFAGAALVVHAASAPASCTDARKIEAINLGGTRAVLEACKLSAVRALVYSSSASVVFDGRAITDVDERQPYPERHVDAAGETRARAEALVLAAASAQLGTCAIRPGILYGQLDPVFVPGLAAAAYCGAARLVLGDGSNFADFTYAENAAHAHVLAAEALLSADAAKRKPVSGAAFFVSDGAPAPFWRTCGLLLAGLGYSAPWLRVPAWLGGLLLGGLSAQTTRFASAHHYFSNEAARKALGYSAPVAEADALAATVQHFAHVRSGSHGLDPVRALLELLASALLAAALCFAGLRPPSPPVLRAAAEAEKFLRPASAALVARGVPGALVELGLLGLALALGAHLLGALLPNAPPARAPRVLPPTIPGKPLVGNLIDFLKGPLDLIAVARQQHRNIFTLRIGPQPITFCCHPEGYETFGRGKDDVLDQAAVYSFTIPAFGKNVVYDAPLDKRLQQIQFVAAIMNTSTMRSYVPKIIMEATNFFNEWGDSGEVELHAAIAQLTTLTASRCLHGVEVRENLCKDVAQLYHDIDGGMQPISTIMPRLPIAAHRRRDRARVELAQLFGSVIDKRKASGTKGDDILQVFIDARYKDGKALTNDEITGLLITLLFAGQHTSSITGTWLGMNIVGYGYLDAIYKEQKAAREANGGELNYDALMAMGLMRNCISETLRLYPPLIFLMRKVVVDRQCRHWTIPRGHILAISPREAGRDERIFPEASSFQPERYAEGGQAEALWSSKTLSDDKKAFSYMAFGTGPHMCLGRRFAFLQLSIIWAVLADMYEMEVVGTIPPPDYDAMVVGPKGDCTIRYKRRVKK